MTPPYTIRLALLGLLALVASGCSNTGAASDVDPPAPRVVVVVKFRSALDAAEIRRRYPERMPRFRELPGLIQKYYLHDAASDEWCGIYVWDSEEAVQAYLESDLRKTIPEAYGVVGTPRVESFQVIDVLRQGPPQRGR